MAEHPLVELLEFALELADSKRYANEGWFYEYGICGDDEAWGEIQAEYLADCKKILDLSESIADML